MNFFSTTNKDEAPNEDIGSSLWGWTTSTINAISKTTQEITKDFTESLKEENKETVENIQTKLGGTKDTTEQCSSEPSESDKDEVDETDDPGRGTVQQRLSKRIDTVSKQIDTIGVNLDDGFLKVEKVVTDVGDNVWNWLGIAPADANAPDDDKYVVPEVNTSRLREQEVLIESNPSTYKRDPEDNEKFEIMKQNISKEAIKKQGSLILQSNEKVRSFYVELVPEEVPQDAFWYRYIFRIREIELEELHRQKEALVRQEQKEQNRKKEQATGEFEWEDASASDKKPSSESPSPAPAPDLAPDLAPASDLAPDPHVSVSVEAEAVATTSQSTDADASSIQTTDGEDRENSQTDDKHAPEVREAKSEPSNEDAPMSASEPTSSSDKTDQLQDKDEAPLGEKAQTPDVKITPENDSENLHVDESPPTASDVPTATNQTPTSTAAETIARKNSSGSSHDSPATISESSWVGVEGVEQEEVRNNNQDHDGATKKHGDSDDDSWGDW